MKKYNTLLQQYTVLSNQIRSLERRAATKKELIEVDKQRSMLHRKLDHTAEKMNKTPDDVRNDILFAQGNLREYRVEAPLIKLPMYGCYYEYNDEEHRIQHREKSDIWDFEEDQVSTQKLFDSNGNQIMAAYRRLWKEGDEAELEKWYKKDYFAVIFSQEQWFFANAVSVAPFKRRQEMKENLARDLKLNLYECHDGSGHRDSTDLQLYGVEVPGDRLDEIAKKMMNNRGKYWLTEDQVKNPYDYVRDEEFNYWAGYGQQEIDNAREKGECKGLLKVYRLYAEREDFELDHYGRENMQMAEELIKKADSELAKEMQADLDFILERAK